MEACKRTAFNYLLKLKDGHSKGSEIIYGSFKLQNYLNSEIINSRQAKLLFKLRSRMVEVRNNYRGKYANNFFCPLCGDTTGEIDTQQHLLLCDKLGNGLNSDVPNYDFIFSFNLEKMKEVVVNFEKALNERNSLVGSDFKKKVGKKKKK